MSLLLISALSPFLFRCESVKKEELWDILIYADDLGILAQTEEELQRKVVEWQEALARKGVKVKQRKQSKS